MIRCAILLLVLAFVTIEARDRRVSDDADIRRDDAHRSYNVRSDDPAVTGQSRSKSSYWKTKQAKERPYLYGSRLPPAESRASLNNYYYYAVWRDFKRTHSKCWMWVMGGLGSLVVWLQRGCLGRSTRSES